MDSKIKKVTPREVDEVRRDIHNRDMLEKRGSPRFNSLAQARIVELEGGEALLRDLSITGCRLEFSAVMALTPLTPCRIIIYPEAASQIEPFELRARERWSHAGYDSFEIGFSIDLSPKGKAFQRYVDYLAWRSTITNPA